MGLPAEAYKKVSSWISLSRVWGSLVTSFFPMQDSFIVKSTWHYIKIIFLFSMAPPMWQILRFSHSYWAFQFILKCVFNSPNTAAILWFQDFKWMLCFRKHSRCLCMTHAGVRPPLLHQHTFVFFYQILSFRLRCKQAFPILGGSGHVSKLLFLFCFVF